MGLKNDIFTAAGRMGDILRKLPPLLRLNAPKETTFEAHLSMLEDRQQRGSEFASLADHPNWKTFDAELSAREEQLLDALRHAPLKDVVRLQAQLAELSFLRRIVPEGIAMGDAAREELEAKEEARG